MNPIDTISIRLIRSRAILGGWVVIVLSLGWVFGLAWLSFRLATTLIRLHAILLPGGRVLLWVSAVLWAVFFMSFCVLGIFGLYRALFQLQIVDADIEFGELLVIHKGRRRLRECPVKRVEVGPRGLYVRPPGRRLFDNRHALHLPQHLFRSEDFDLLLARFSNGAVGPLAPATGGPPPVAALLTLRVHGVRALAAGLVMCIIGAVVCGGLIVVADRLMKVFREPHDLYWLWPVAAVAACALTPLGVLLFASLFVRGIMLMAIAGSKIHVGSVIGSVRRRGRLLRFVAVNGICMGRSWATIGAMNQPGKPMMALRIPRWVFEQADVAAYMRIPSAVAATTVIKPRID